MNKRVLALGVERALKNAGYRNSVLRGTGWNGNGMTYRRQGFVLDTNRCLGVAVTYHYEDLLPLAMTMRAETDIGKQHAACVRNEKEKWSAKYTDTLITSGFLVDNKRDDLGLAYVLVIGSV